MSTSPKTPAEALAYLEGPGDSHFLDPEKFRAALALLRRHLEPQPIETAPRDGTRVLLFPTGWNDNYPEVGFWETDRFAKKPKPFWRYDRWNRTIGREHPPTHWLPLPAPANQESEDAD